MNCIDYSDASPARNIALDEALLNVAEDVESADIMRFWESPVPFVVLGVNQRVSEETNESFCSGKKIPILRRCSAGGCVLQGPGCLNYTLVLNSDREAKLASINSSYDYILGKISNAFSDFGVQPAGISDLKIDDQKISGSAQRRRKRTILHHGTILYGFDLNLITECLKEPSDRPKYRGERNHRSFVRNLSLPVLEIKGRLLEAFSCSESSMVIPLHILEQGDMLVREKYSTAKWNFRK